MPTPGKTYRMINQAIIELEALEAVILATKKAMSTIQWYKAANNLRASGAKLPTLTFHDTLLKDYTTNLTEIRGAWNTLCQKARSLINTALFNSTKKTEEEHAAIEARIINSLTEMYNMRTAYLAILEYLCKDDNHAIDAMRDKIAGILPKLERAPYPENFPQDAYFLHRYIHQMRAVLSLPESAEIDTMDRLQRAYLEASTALLHATREKTIGSTMREDLNAYRVALDKINIALSQTIQSIGARHECVEAAKKAIQQAEDGLEEIYKAKEPTMKSSSRGTPAQAASAKSSLVADWTTLPDYKGKMTTPALSDVEIAAIREKYAPLFKPKASESPTSAAAAAAAYTPSTKK